MKVLFVCKSNFGRSQMAEAIYNNLTNSKDAKSAGLAVEDIYLGQHLSTYENYVIPSMKEIGLNLSSKKPKQLTRRYFNWADKVIVMEGNKSIWKDYLKDSDKVIFWDIPDPRGTELNFHNKVRDKIKKNIEDFLI